ncbi:hypothetical protein NLU13_7062 [Sarocladium strictum]|uniref:Short-chain dehydrogenase n=1 Tax=Sarocladium strictum TaxID=5046 RepID=A0AA39GEJ9_SARSR|nr:hypothetical protein NLU13_7062 [Sarocladium strictum]
MAPMPQLSSLWTQAFPPKPHFTEASLPDLQGKVYLITGANTGIGKDLARILYSKNARVYMAARSRERAEAAMEDIKRTAPGSKGDLIFLLLDLGDLSTIRGTAEEFTARESRLHVLFNNAGMQSTETQKPLQTTPQGYEVQLGVNVMGPFLLTKLLTPTLVETARRTESAAASVRVVWVSSSGAELLGEEGVGLPLDNLDYHVPRTAMQRYGLSKAGSWLHGVEFARRYRAQGVVSIPLNPGNLNSDLYRGRGPLAHLVIRAVTYPTLNGAYTELFAGLSPEVTMDHSGEWVVPFGRFLPIRRDLQLAARTEAEGGNGHAEQFWEWTEKQVAPFC